MANQISMEDRAANVRKQAKEVRKTILGMIHDAASGHPGASTFFIEISGVLCIMEEQQKHGYLK